MVNGKILGNCFICGKTAAKTAMKNHIMKEHNDGAEQCYLIKAEGMYDKDYWLLFTVPVDATLSVLDKFLRQIWCECCGHMSAFFAGGEEFGKSKKMSSLRVGGTMRYDYDFGSTTEIKLTVVDEILRKKQREKVLLLARNEPHGELCDHCGAPAALINAWENEVICGECSKDVEDEAALLPIVNSPRCGECGYDGEQDKWFFNPEKLDVPKP